MLKANAKKTKSAPKKLKNQPTQKGLAGVSKKLHSKHLGLLNKVLLVFLLSLSLLMLIAAGLVVYDYTSGDKKYLNKKDAGKIRCLEVAEGCIRLEVAKTSTEMAKGLSGRESLPSDRGMLFKFAKPSELCFWMKDMQFNLDIIWLNKDKQITKIERNLSPATYPSTYCSDNSKYVIELNAGQAGYHGLSVGQRLSF